MNLTGNDFNARMKAEWVFMSQPMEQANKGCRYRCRSSTGRRL